MDNITREYVGWLCKHPIDAMFRILRWINIDADMQQRDLLCNAVLGLPDRVARQFDEELKYIYGRMSPETFPYDVVRPGMKLSGGCDSGYPYVSYKGSNVFFPRNMQLCEAVSMCEGLVNDEGILGTGIRKKSPHSYVADGFEVEHDSVVVDVGSAEGLFSLENVQVASLIYLFECDKKWFIPLSRTFADYPGKVTTVRKRVSNRTSGDEILLADALRDVNPHKHLFVKMDIEGAERFVLSAAVDFLKQRKTKIACCVYHRQDDAQVLTELLEHAGFKVSFSDGWMLPLMNGVHYPYFRHGVLRAVNY